MRGDGCGNGCSHSFQMTLPALERQDLSVWLQNSFSVWCLCANDPTRPQCPRLSSDTWANHLKPLHRHVCQDPTLPRGLTHWQALGRGALCCRAHEGAAERQLSPSSQTMGGGMVVPGEIQPVHGRKSEKTLKTFSLLIHNPALRGIEIAAISVYQVDSYEIADN